MKQYKEIRVIRASSLRALCVRQNWYTAGDNDEYGHLLLDLAGSKENLSTADIMEIAADSIATWTMTAPSRAWPSRSPESPTCFSRKSEPKRAGARRGELTYPA